MEPDNLTANLRRRLIALLEQIDTFRDNRAIEDLFTQSPRLASHARHLALPGSHNPNARRVVAYLFDEKNPQRFDLVAELLELLPDETADDPVKVQIARLASDIEFLRREELPVVVAAMRRGEAQELLAMAPAALPPELRQAAQDAQIFGAAMQQNGYGVRLAELPPTYGDEREGWCPYEQNRPVLTMIRELVDLMARKYDPTMPALNVRPYSLDAFTAPDRGGLDAVTLAHGFLVIDALSLYHPAVKLGLAGLAAAFVANQAPLAVAKDKAAAGPGWAVLVLTPDGAYLEHAHRLRQQLMTELVQLVPHRHGGFGDRNDLLCEFGILDAVALYRRLSSMVPEVARLHLVGGAPRARQKSSKDSFGRLPFSL